MITGDTITDEQIQELALTNLTAAQHIDCETALTKTDRHTTRFERNRRKWARSRCAEILNAREIEQQETKRERRKSDLADHNTDK